jgi:hypothetical protein
MFTARAVGGDARASLAIPARRRPWRLAHDFGPALALVAALVAAAQLLTLATPERAEALDLNPLHWIGSLAGDALGVGTGIFVRGFVAIINSLFSGFEAKLTLSALTWLTSLDNQSGGHITTLYNLTSGMAIGLLGAVITVSIVRYWIAGLSMSGSGGFEALEGLMRSIGAVGFLLIWPVFFGLLINLSNVASATILGDPPLRAEIAHIINTVVLVTVSPGGDLTLFIGIVIAIVGGLLFLALLFMKVMIGATVTFLFIAMPLAVILWPIDELAWLARYALRAFICLLIVPVVWALIFATFAAITTNALEFQGAHGFLNQVTQPLVALAMLWLTITIPRTLFKLASGGLGMGRHGGGFVSRAGSYLAARQAGMYLAERGMLPFGQGGFASSQSGGTPQRGSGRGGGSGTLRTTTAAATSVTGLAAAAGGPAGAVLGVAAAAETTAAAAEAASEVDTPQAGASDARESDPAPGQEQAVGPAVANTRPERDHPNPLQARPPGTEGNQTALQDAMSEVRKASAPSLEEAHAARRRLGTDVLAHMSDSFQGGGPSAVQAEMALMATSSRISNGQAQDFMTLARAGNADGMTEHLLGLQDAPPTQQGGGSLRTPSSGEALPGSGSYGAGSKTPPSATPEEPRQQWTPERSAKRETRDAAWREGGTGVNPRQE